MKERFNPILLQTKAYAIGFQKPVAFEHKGESETFYTDNAIVDKGELKLAGVWIPLNSEMVTVHKDESLTAYIRDGVPVELITLKAHKELQEGK